MSQRWFIAVDQLAGPTFFTKAALLVRAVGTFVVTKYRQVDPVEVDRLECIIDQQAHRLRPVAFAPILPHRQFRWTSRRCAPTSQNRYRSTKPIRRSSAQAADAKQGECSQFCLQPGSLSCAGRVQLGRVRIQEALKFAVPHTRPPIEPRSSSNFIKDKRTRLPDRLGAFMRPPPAAGSNSGPFGAQHAKHQPVPITALVIDGLTLAHFQEELRRGIQPAARLVMFFHLHRDRGTGSSRQTHKRRPRLKASRGIKRPLFRVANHQVKLRRAVHPHHL